MTEDIDQKIVAFEAQMAVPGFWADKGKAQALIKEYQELKLQKEGRGKYDKGNAIVTIFGGAGGTDAEDFAAMLARMYWKYVEKRGWVYNIRHANENDHGGYRNITFEIEGKNAYGTLKNESGVHRLVRISPFNANAKRHTSFAMVEVIPKLTKPEELPIPESELDVQFTRSGGPGGQNVNKRETAVRIVHIPTGLAVHIDTERSQQQNRERGLEILRGKLYHKREAERKLTERGLSVASTTEAEWGNQIRSYVLHPYQLVKDHRTNVEVHDAEGVLEEGKLDDFVEAEAQL